MDDLQYGKRNKRGDWQPNDAIGIAPLFVFPPQPLKFIKWLPGYIFPWNVLFLALAAIFWFYLTPVIYPLSSVPAEYRGWMYLNPMTGVVETFKWAALGIGELNLQALGASTVVLLIVLWCGLVYFDRAEGSSVDQL